MRSVLLLKIQCHIAFACLLMHRYTDRHLFLGILYITANPSYFPEERSQFPPSDCLVCCSFICFFLQPANVLLLFNPGAVEIADLL